MNKPSALLALILVCLAGGAAAGSFTITPVRVFLSPKDRVVAMTVVNEADERLVLQTELFAWSQTADGQEQLVESDDLLVAPPIISVPPKGRQVIRLAVTQAPYLSRQRTYRLFVREIVEANMRPKDNEVAIPIALTLSLPVFITPPGFERAVTCQAQAGATALQLRVLCRNGGRAYAQLRRVVAAVAGKEFGAFDGAVYLLPGAQREVEINLKTTLAAGSLQLQVSYDDEKAQVFEVPGR